MGREASNKEMHTSSDASLRCCYMPSTTKLHLPRTMQIQWWFWQSWLHANTQTTVVIHKKDVSNNISICYAIKVSINFDELSICRWAGKCL